MQLSKMLVWVLPLVLSMAVPGLALSSASEKKGRFLSTDTMAKQGHGRAARHTVRTLSTTVYYNGRQAEGRVGQPIKHVYHKKKAGSGYLPGSPLHEKQQKMEAEAAQKGPEDVKFDEEVVPPVPTSVQCIVNLTIQYFGIYTALAILRTMNSFRGSASSPAMNIVQAATATVNFAPMLCVLFVAARMRGTQLAQGQTEKYQLPQPWVQNCMQICTWTLLVQLLLVLIVPVVLGSENVETDDDGNLKTQPRGSGSRIVGMVLTLIRYLAMLALYGGFTAICYGVYTMEAPKEIWGDEEPPVAPAIRCTIDLTAQYFAVYLALAICKTMDQFQAAREPSKGTQVFTLAAYTVNFAPMLCILFIGARMRALQIDPRDGAPQSWAQVCFYLCNWSVLLQTLLVIIVPFAFGGEAEKGASEGDIAFVIKNRLASNILVAIRWVALLALYGGFTAVVCSVYMIQHPRGEGHTPPISPALACVMNLTAQFFLVYLLQWVAITWKQVLGGGRAAIRTAGAAVQTVTFCPMLSVLFIATRMYALQVSDGKGAPQVWAQQCMYLASYAVLCQVCLVFVLALLSGPPEMDEDGNVKAKGIGSPLIRGIVEAVRYLCMLAMYGGAVAVVVSIFLITPKSAVASAEASSSVTVLG